MKNKQQRKVRKPNKKQQADLQAVLDTFTEVKKEYEKAIERVNETFSNICADRLKIPLRTKFKRTRWSKNKTYTVTGFSFSHHLWGSQTLILLKSDGVEGLNKMNEIDILVHFRTVDRIGRPNGAENTISLTIFRTYCEIVE